MSEHISNGWHLDPLATELAGTYVVQLSSQGSYRAACRDCTWQQVRPSPALAEACRRSHRCPAAEVRRPVKRLRTRADLLAGALEHMGWSVADDDPRAEEFLDRFIELGRAQKNGRISRDGAHETLRREFPLR
jgi:hypothetical protein